MSAETAERTGKADVIPCGCSSMVEPQPSKLMTAVQFRSPAPAEAGYVFGSCPYSSVVEHFLGKKEVTGSTPVMGSMQFTKPFAGNYYVEREI